MITIQFKTANGSEAIFVFSENSIIAYLGICGYKIAQKTRVDYQKAYHNELTEIQTKEKGIYVGKKFLKLKEALIYELDKGSPNKFMRLALIYNQEGMLN